MTPGFVTTFKLVPLSNKLLALVTLPSGQLAYLPASDSTRVFSILTFRTCKKSLFSNAKAGHYGIIYMATAFKKISNLEVRPGDGIQYVRSAGCFAKIVKFDYSNHAALVKLPSGVRKFFSFYSILLNLVTVQSFFNE